MQVPTLETERLLLRPWRAEDVGAYARILADPEVLRYLGSGVRYRVKRAVAAVVAALSNIEATFALTEINRHWQRRGFGLWAVVEKQSGRLIGNAGLTELDDWSTDPSRIEIGWLLARSAWGQGLAMESGRASLAYAFNGLGLPRVVSVALAANVRSARAAQRLGLAFVGRTRWKGNDVVWHAMDRAEWVRDEADGPRSLAEP